MKSKQLLPMRRLPKNNSNTRWVDWLSALFLLILLQIAAARLVATLWTDDLHLVQITTLMATIIGLALGKSIFNRFWVVFFAVAYGLLIIPWQIGLTLEHEIRWNDRLANLWGRLEIVLRELLSRNPVTDNLLFLLLMAILFWFIAVYSAHTLVRGGSPWKVVIPAGIAAFVIHSFDPLLISRSWYLAFYLFFALLLVARIVYLRNIRRWKEGHTHTPPDMGFDFTRVALLLSLLLVFFAWNVPVVAETLEPAARIWQTASRPWLTTKDRFGFLFASLKASVGLVQNFYGNSLPLGLGNPLSDQVIMEVEGLTSPPNGYRYYWEARTYSTYEDNQWQTDLRTAHELTANSLDLTQPGADIRPIVTSIFFPHVPISNLYNVPEPLWVNLPTQALMKTNPDGTINFGALMSKSIIRPGEQYTMRSAIDAVTVAELQDAGTDYPQWVLDEYLQLPANITPRTEQLAEEIAFGLQTPYEITNAITEYLRTNMEYNQSVSLPPPNQERIDWFLFDYKKGFCNYYASSEVILLRSLGIPARMAVGFAQGEREIPPIQEQPGDGSNREDTQDLISETSTYVVRERDAHAWPEVYFPGIGWVIFEPTASQPAFFRPSGEEYLNQNEPQITQGQENPENLQNPDNADQRRPDDKDRASNMDRSVSFWTIGNIVKIIALILTLDLLVILIWQVRKGFKLVPFFERISVEIPEGIEKGFIRLGIRPPEFLVSWIFSVKLPALARSYQEINHALKRLGKEPGIQDTPFERASALIDAIPSISTPVTLLLSEYQASVYSSHQANAELARKAGIEIRNSSWLARLGKLLARFQEPN
jgi:transglutaminase-like putative cysteine protease